MIDLKSEILGKRQKEDKKVDLYNSVIKEYIPQIKDIFDSDSLKVDCQEVDKLIKITIISKDEKTKYVFSYSSIKKCLYINPSDDLADRSMIENKLKEFVLKIAEKEDVRIKEPSVRGKRRELGIIEESASDLPTYNKAEEIINPIAFKHLLEREKDKYNVIYGLFNNILEVNLDSIKEAIGDNYKVEIQYNKSKANNLYIEDERSLGERYCYIKYENVNQHKSFGYTKEEIEEYLQRIVISFVMEYDK